MYQFELLLKFIFDASLNQFLKGIVKFSSTQKGAILQKSTKIYY